MSTRSWLILITLTSIPVLEPKKVKHYQSHLNVTCLQTSKFHHQISISNELLRMCTLCARLFFSTLLQWKFIYAKTFQLFNFKTRLDGEVCSSDFNMQNGNSVGAGRCLWLAYFTYYHIVRLASFLRWFHLWRVDSSPAFCLVQWHTDTQHRKDMLHKSVAAEKETYVKNYVKFINTRCSVSSQEQTLRRELRIRSASCSGVFLLSGTHHSDLLLISTTALYCKMSFPVYYDHMFI